jgi:hypothetical protein
VAARAVRCARPAPGVRRPAAGEAPGPEAPPTKVAAKAPPVAVPATPAVSGAMAAPPMPWAVPRAAPQAWAAPSVAPPAEPVGTRPCPPAGGSPPVRRWPLAAHRPPAWGAPGRRLRRRAGPTPPREPSRRPDSLDPRNRPVRGNQPARAIPLSPAAIPARPSQKAQPARLPPAQRPAPRQPVPRQQAAPHRRPAPPPLRPPPRPHPAPPRARAPEAAPPPPLPGAPATPWARPAQQDPAGRQHGREAVRRWPARREPRAPPHSARDPRRRRRSPRLPQAHPAPPARLGRRAKPRNPPILAQARWRPGMAGSYPARSGSSARS